MGVLPSLLQRNRTKKRSEDDLHYDTEIGTHKLSSLGADVGVSTMRVAYDAEGRNGNILGGSQAQRIDEFELSYDQTMPAAPESSKYGTNTVVQGWAH